MNSGVILLNKPAGITSFDCIRKLKKILNRTDLGHAGTLDNFATGLLPIFFGESLKLVRFFQEPYPNLSSYWKSYSGVIVLGVSTDTLDPTGLVTQEAPIPSNYLQNLSIDFWNQALQTFTQGEYLQTPPEFSAKKIDGIRASDRVRTGETVVLKPNLVCIEKITCTNVTLNSEQKIEVSFEVNCSKGTYIRALARDFGNKLNLPAHLKSLHRTRVGSFSIEQAHTFSEIEANAESCALSLWDSCSFLPKTEILDIEKAAFKKGSFLELKSRIAQSDLTENVYCLMHSKDPLALVEIKKNESFMRQTELLRVFNSQI